ncbi:HigA family addiction module antidote protein [Tianweitania sp. BSSL-BM11]|uniref:HigA family addiction module antidote protein n=1 Tax=Tianweitania aestuarii TaxID=2814886 RepID=A0ABS5RRW6_9HYPH|nr:HigA family addiction module antitoxin [Tianweitania aestuarii]MBS9719798.1 HigA family addiction module antidote protein [Tianweitania aestuarii]
MLKFANPVHPGEFLREEYLGPLGLSAGMLARKLDLPRTRIERLVKEEVSLTADTALRIARFFGTSPEFWMNFQQAYDLHREEAHIAQELSKIQPLEVRAA